jgi:hypothetical protein
MHPPVAPEVVAALACIAAATREILALWPLTDRNEWAGSIPPPEIVEALRLLTTASGHLRNLQDFGPASQPD